MIKIKIKRNPKRNIIDFTVKGHAQADQPGEDIVCAAISAIVQTALFGLKKYLGLEFEYQIKDGFLRCLLADEIANDSQVKAILETMVIGLKETEKEYSQYINLTTEGGGKYV